MRLLAWSVAGVVAVTATGQDGWRLDKPMLIEASGKAIDVGSDIGHAGPLLRDVDRDGLQDLLVSSFRGNIRVFKNVGTAEQPKYEGSELMRAGNDPIRIHNW